MVKKRMVIFGASGFLGSWISMKASLKDYEVIGVVRSDSSDWRLRGLSKFNLIKLDDQNWEEALSNLKPNIVVSADWQGVNKKNRYEKLQMSNVDRIYKLARTSQRLNVERFVAIGSQAENYSMAENEQIMYYKNAKIELREKLRALFKGSKTELLWVRAFSVYGPMQSKDTFISELIESCLTNQFLLVRNGNQKVNLLHVADFCDALLLLLENELQDYEVNVANFETQTINSIAQLILNQLHKNNQIAIKNGYGSNYQNIDLSPKLSELRNLGWSPKIALKEGLIDLIYWQSNELSGKFVDYKFDWKLPLLKNI